MLLLAGGRMVIGPPIYSTELPAFAAVEIGNYRTLANHWRARFFPCNLPAMPTTSDLDRPLKWYQGLDRYCWVVLIVAALGWLFDTMDQNIYNLVRVPSLREMLH